MTTSPPTPPTRTTRAPPRRSTSLRRRDGPAGGPVAADATYELALQQLPADGSVVVVGHASFEPTTSAGYNLLLSERRARVARAIYEQLSPGRCDPTAVTGMGHTVAQPAQSQCGEPRAAPAMVACRAARPGRRARRRVRGHRQPRAGSRRHDHRRTPLPRPAARASRAAELVPQRRRQAAARPQRVRRPRAARRDRRRHGS